MVCCAARDDDDDDYDDDDVMMIYTKLENCDLLGYFAASSGNLLPTFHENLSVPSSGTKNPKILGRWKTGPIGCPETS